MLGDLLRKAREEKNLSLNDIEKETNIRKLYIKAIEDGDYDKLPGEVFLKGFIKTYAKFLGMDGQAMVAQYKAEKNGAAPAADTAAAPQQEEQEASEQKDEPKEEKAAEDTAKEEAGSGQGKVNILNTGSDEYLKPQSSGSKKNIIILVVIIVAIIAGAAAYLSSQSSDEPKPAAPPASSQEAQPQAQQQPAQQPAAPASGAQVSAVFAQDCWTEVKVDGNVVLSETVKAGSNLNWTGTKEIEVTVGNAGAADFTFNGQPAGKLGAEGAVVTKKFTAPDAAAAPAANAQPAQQQ